MNKASKEIIVNVKKAVLAKKYKMTTKLHTSKTSQELWDNLFDTRDYTKVFWHQKSPDISLELINSHTKSKDDSILDVGCGASFLVEKLIEQEYVDINLLDISKVSLDIVKKRLANDSNIPTYINSDITNFKSDKKFDIWHDRAVFHFLLLKDDRDKYFEVLKAVLKPDGFALISTFTNGGDNQCAGLSVLQYNDKKMIDELPIGLELVEYNEFIHKTPKETSQKYCSFVIKKV